MDIIENKKKEISELTLMRNQYMQQGKTLEESEVLRKLVKLTEEVYGFESDENIKILNELGGTLKYVNAFEEAESALVKARNLIEKRYGNNNISYATCNLNLAELYRFMKKYDEIESLYFKTMSIYENNNLQNDYLYASVCNNLGLFYQEIQEYEKAISLHEKSLDILGKLENYNLQYATTVSNMVIPYSKLGYKEKSEEYLKKSLYLIEKEVGKEHNLYSASLNNLAIYYYNEGDMEKSLELFEESAKICEKSFGKDSNNYKNLLSNINFVKETIEKRKNLEQNIKHNIKGMDLSKLYFEKVYMPKIKERFPDLYSRIAVGLSGEGSECFGFDDEISTDHDFGPSCCIWLSDEDYNKYERELNEVIDELPKEFMGYKALEKSEWGNNRRGVLKISDWYYKFLGVKNAPENIDDWLKIPETNLSIAVNGEVFLDNLGQFSKIREKLIEYYPEDIRKNKIATRCMKISQSGQYNFFRCMNRNEILAARMAENEFISEVIHMIYLLNKKYLIFYKWAPRGLKNLPILGEIISKILNEIIEKNLYDTKGKEFYIEEICKEIIKELKNQKLVSEDIKSNFLQDYGLPIQKSIKDENMRNWPPMVEIIE